jgi:thiazole/oxazole-forming peptide maturase SagD family component
MSTREIARRSTLGTDPKVKRQIDRMVSPLLGPIRRLMALSYDASSPALYTVLPELVDVHRRAGLLTAPEYHLGGYGFSIEEAMRKALGESVERAALMTFHVNYAHLLRRASHQELTRQGNNHLPLHDLAAFSPEQRAQPTFPFTILPEVTPITWVPTLDLQNDKEILLPAQAVLNGFPCLDEERMTLAVSTGTATHINYQRAFRSALLEILQIDAAMGHWYSNASAPRIDISKGSTPRFANFLECFAPWWKREDSIVEFYWLKQPDKLPVYIVVCAIRRPNGYPAMALGLGISFDLDSALYSAFVEAVPVNFIALVNGLDQLYETRETDATPVRRAKDIRTAYRSAKRHDGTDFDSNVGYYALPENALRIFSMKFNPNQLINGNELRQKTQAIPPETSFDEANRILLSQILRKHRIFAIDLTSLDCKELGYRVVRLFSPDLMPLCAPIYPQAAHPRFEAYGGYDKTIPHPYP